MSSRSGSDLAWSSFNSQLINPPMDNQPNFAERIADARTNKPIAQLTIYALALSHLTGIKLFDIKCAWFNENEYCEFFPRTLLSRGQFKQAA
jgi:hypothetical protein